MDLLQDPNLFHTFYIQDLTWTYVSLPEEHEPGVRGYKVCVANSKIFIFQDPLNTVVEYDPLAQSCTRWYRINTNENDHGAIVECDNCVYVLTSGHRGVELSVTVEVLDLEWELLYHQKPKNPQSPLGFPEAL